MKYRELKINLPKENSDKFTEFLNQREIFNYFENLLDLEDHNRKFLSEDTNIFVYLEENEIQKELEVHIYLKINHPEDSICESRLIESRDYEEAYKEYYKPFNIGKFLIIPSWEKNSVQLKKNEIPLFLNPGLAFGTGHHETTFLMLERMAEIIIPGMSILDMGTGSGILSIGSGLLGAKKIVSIDIDKNAVSATLANIKENNFLEDTFFKVMEGSFEKEELTEAKFDIFLANITFAVISRNINSIKKANTDRFLFSGLLLEKKEETLNLLSQLGGKIEYFNSKNDWLLIDWKR